MIHFEMHRSLPCMTPWLVEAASNTRRSGYSGFWYKVEIARAFWKWNCLIHFESHTHDSQYA